MIFTKATKEKNAQCLYQGEVYTLLPRIPKLINADLPQLVMSHSTDSIILVPIAEFHINNRIYNDQDLYTHYRMEKNASTFYSYKLINQIPTPEQGEEALYLAYVYLANSQAERAVTLLEQCNSEFGGISPTDQEIKYLLLITNLPLEAPEPLVCRLKALYC